MNGLICKDFSNENGVYQCQAESQSLTRTLGFGGDVIHLSEGEKIYNLIAVFAPTRITTVDLEQRWWLWNEKLDSWVTRMGLAGRCYLFFYWARYPDSGEPPRSLEWVWRDVVIYFSIGHGIQTAASPPEVYGTDAIPASHLISTLLLTSIIGRTNVD